MTIRQANLNDIEKIMKMYNSCVAGMIKMGIDQWDNTYPNKEIIQHDIQNKTFYVLTEKNKIICLLYTSPSPRDMRRSRMPSSA